MSTKNIYKTHWESGMSYESYISLTRNLLEERKTTGDEPDKEDLVSYTDINLQRMIRVYKTTQPDSELVSSFKRLSGNYGLLVVSEAWCGDAAQSLPVLGKLSQESGLEMRVVLRDESPELMNLHLTNGGKSIPVVLLIKLDEFELIAQWGPRPKPAQQMVIDYKKSSEPKEPYSEFVKSVQLWYAKDKQQTIQEELKALVSDQVQEN